ncbi:MAG: MmcQ/YjbR family DNA-binding protein [Bacteroidales bacterium]
MNIEQVREYCLSKAYCEECLPFDDEHLVFKVCGKMFALLALSTRWLNLKCDPSIAIELREQFEAVTGGYHMNKKHWNSINLQGNIPNKLLCEWIDNSYHLVVKKLTKAQQQELLNLTQP